MVYFVNNLPHKFHWPDTLTIYIYIYIYIYSAGRRKQKAARLYYHWNFIKIIL